MMDSAVLEATLSFTQYLKKKCSLAHFCNIIGLLACHYTGVHKAKLQRLKIR